MCGLAQTADGFLAIGGDFHDRLTNRNRRLIVGEPGHWQWIGEVPEDTAGQLVTLAVTSSRELFVGFRGYHDGAVRDRPLRWDGREWRVLPSVERTEKILIGRRDEVYVGGGFRRAEGRPAPGFARWQIE